MPIFIERFLLPLLATATFALIILNPMKFDRTQQATLGVAVIAFAFFLAHTLHLYNKSISNPPAPVQATPAPTVAAKENHDIQISVQLLPPLLAEKPQETAVTSVLIYLVNHGPQVEHDITLLLGMPEIKDIEFDEPERFKLLGGGGQNSNFVHLFVPELVPYETRSPTVHLATPSNISSAEEWQKRFGYDKSIWVTRLAFGPVERVTMPRGYVEPDPPPNSRPPTYRKTEKD